VYNDDPLLRSGQLHIACTTAKIDKVKDIVIISLKVSLAYEKFVLCQEKSWATLITPSHPFDEMFIFSGKLNCIAATALLLASSLHCC